MFAWQLYQHRDLVSSHCLHATSENEAVEFRRLGFKQPIILVPNGVSLPKSIAADETAGSSGVREVLFLSRIHPVKGLPNLIEAWQHAKRPGWRLSIVGSDEDGHKAELQQQIIQNGLRDSVAIYDAVHSEAKWTLLRNADVVVLPSFSENFGIVVAEALAVCTPVITTTGTPWDRVVNNDCGWYVEPTTEGLLSGLTDAMQQSPSKLRLMGERGREWVLSTYAWSDIGHRMISAYAQLLGVAAEECSSHYPADIRRAA